VHLIGLQPALTPNCKLAGPMYIDVDSDDGVGVDVFHECPPSGKFPEFEITDVLCDVSTLPVALEVVID
jgi:hypothetical protein